MIIINQITFEKQCIVGSTLGEENYWKEVFWILISFLLITTSTTTSCTRNKSSTGTDKNCIAGINLLFNMDFIIPYLVHSITVNNMLYYTYSIT
jgi:hypothetical protein